MYQNTTPMLSVHFMVCVCQPSKSGRRQCVGKTDGCIPGGGPWAVSSKGHFPAVCWIVWEMRWSGQVHRMTPPPIPVFLFAGATTSTLHRLYVVPPTTTARPPIATASLVFAPLRAL